MLHIPVFAVWGSGLFYICFLIAEILKDENYITDYALNSEEALIKFNVAADC